MIALVFFIAGLVLLLLSGPVAGFLRIEELTKQYGGLIGVVVTVSFVVLLLQIVLRFGSRVYSLIAHRQQRRATIEHLRSLSAAEQEVLRYCVEQNRQTIPGTDTWDICALVEKRFLEIPVGQSLGRRATACTIPEYVWRHLMDKCGGSNGKLQFP